MSFIDNGNGNGFYMPVSPAYGSGNGGWGNGFGGDGAWWLLVLILAMNGGWGNGRFVSMNDGYSNRSYHSVNDRIIASLERELNGDISDFERKRIMDEIQRLREMKD